MNGFIENISHEENSIVTDDLKHTIKCLEQGTRIPAMYDLGKLHKGKIYTPPYRLVVVIDGCLLYEIGQWVDDFLNELLPYCKTRIKTDDVLRILIELKKVYEGYFVTTCDANSMCKKKLKKWLEFEMEALDAFVFKNRSDWLREYLLLAIRLLLKWNVFHFYDVYFRHIESGTMGNQFACIWAAVYFVFFEYLILESKNKIIH